MQLGTHIWSFTGYENTQGGFGGELARAGEAAERAGLTHLSVMDHFFQLEHLQPAETPMLEGYTALGHLAAHTSTVRLGMLVGGVTYRHPGLLIKTVTTLDVLSGGRAWFGIGAGWYEREHRGLGVPFPPTAERFERLEETLRISQAMWDPASTAPFEGKHFQLAETLCVPAPVSKPRPPVMIGGEGERKTLRFVAKYADMTNMGTHSDLDGIRRKLDVLRGHCADLGRDFDSIEKTVLYNKAQLSEDEVDGFVELMSGYAEAGIDTVFLMPLADRPASEWIEAVGAPLVPRLAAL
ncbi:LLM class F420-dependent oxidoreductase [Sciscionella marina]|uniref:LLM class F420-dependent oxidoreductase n=1 Tax=Sciscionella marina TaxID=508770 RepID=UPI00037CB444|nr:LLM class F420-dependent oxidoreductase [Sciscionella marina]